jgi:hypothetical protein
MNILHARLNNVISRQKSKAAVTTITTVVTAMPEVRSSNTSNQAVHKTMSISMIASLIQGLQADVRKVAERIIQTQKFHTLPQLVSREEIDRKVLDDGETLLFVGIRDLPKRRYHNELKSEERAKNLKTGEDYLVNGILGPAIYAVQAIRDPKAKDNDEAAIMHAYEQAVEYSRTQNNKGVVLRMSLKADARTITYNDFLKILSVNSAQIKSELRNYPSFSTYLNVFLNTPTLIAIAQGYDAIVNIPDGSVIILNRGALRIQKTNATSKNAMYAQIQMEIDAELQAEREKKEAAEKKKKEQEKNARDQEKKIAMQKKQQEEVSNLHPQLQAKKSSNTWSFDSDIISRVVNDNSLSQSEKSEIVQFVSLYNQSSESVKQDLSEQLKEMLGL